VNFAIAGAVATRGDLSFNSLPLTNADLRTSSALFAYARVLDLGGKSGKFDVIVPYTWLSAPPNTGANRWNATSMDSAGRRSGCRSTCTAHRRSDSASSAPGSRT
jgi:hypothetical protein